MLGNNPGDLVAAAIIDTATDALVNGSSRVSSLSTTTATKKWRVTLQDDASGNSTAIAPSATILCASGAGFRMATVNYVSAGVYDVEVVDALGAAAAGSTYLYLLWRRTRSY